MKKIAALLCAFALTLALPMAAFAAGGSPEAGGVHEYDSTQFSTGNGPVYVTGKISGLQVASTTNVANNVPAGANVIGSYQITGTIEEGTAFVALGTGNMAKDSKVNVYIQHAASSEVQTANVKDGFCGVTVSEFSTFTVVNPGNTAAPKTGIDYTDSAVALGVTLITAGAVAVYLRRKVSE